MSRKKSKHAYCDAQVVFYQKVRFFIEIESQQKIQRLTKLPTAAALTCRRARRLLNGVRFLAPILLLAAFSTTGCELVNSLRRPSEDTGWKQQIDHKLARLGYRNWVVVAEASFPAQSRPGVTQLAVPVDVPEAADYVLKSLERTENLRPKIYLTRELRAVENDFAPGIDQLRQKIHASLHGHESTELDQQSLFTLLNDATRSFEITVIRTTSTLPYSSVFMELQPGYWDSDSENRLRERMQAVPSATSSDRLQKLARPF